VSQKRSQDVGHGFRELTLVNGLIHQRHPAIAGLLVDAERGVSHSQLGMSAALQVVLWAAEAKQKKQSQTLFGPGQICRRVHGTQQIVPGNLPVECSHQTLDAIAADRPIDVIFSQRRRRGIHERGITSEDWGVCIAAVKQPAP
jgi:hypothetical protein